MKKYNWNVTDSEEARWDGEDAVGSRRDAAAGLLLSRFLTLLVFSSFLAELLPLIEALNLAELSLLHGSSGPLAGPSGFPLLDPPADADAIALGHGHPSSCS